MTSLRSKRFRRSINFRASSKGHAFDDSAASRKGADNIFFLFETQPRERTFTTAEIHTRRRSTSRAKLHRRLCSADECAGRLSASSVSRLCPIMRPYDEIKHSRPSRRAYQKIVDREKRKRARGYSQAPEFGGDECREKDC